MRQELPGWLVQLLQPADSSAAKLHAEGKTPSAAAGLSLPACLAAADISRLATTLTSRLEGAPWLLQPLVRAPTLVQGDFDDPITDDTRQKWLCWVCS